MKRFLGFIMVLACILLMSAKAYDFSHGTSVLKPGVRIVCPSPQLKLIPFADLDSKKIGFLRNTSNMNVILPPVYENGKSEGFLLFPVMKGGKWGVVDLGCRYSVKGKKLYDPIIPCIYKDIEVKDDNIVICDGKTIDIRKLGYEPY